MIERNRKRRRKLSFAMPYATTVATMQGYIPSMMTINGHQDVRKVQTINGHQNYGASPPPMKTINGHQSKEVQTINGRQNGEKLGEGVMKAGENDYYCRYCQKAFKSAWAVRGHLRACKMRKEFLEIKKKAEKEAKKDLKEGMKKKIIDDFSRVAENVQGFSHYHQVPFQAPFQIDLQSFFSNHYPHLVHFINDTRGRIERLERWVKWIAVGLGVIGGLFLFVNLVRKEEREAVKDVVRVAENVEKISRRFRK